MGSEFALESLLFAAQLALSLALIALIVKLTAIAISNGFHSPYLATPHEFLPKIAETLDIRPDDIVYDIGSGDGRLMIFCAQRYPHATFVGIERNPLLIAYARLQKILCGSPQNVSFRCQDFFSTNFDAATRLYAYLLPVTLNKLFADVSRQNRRLVSRAYMLKDRKPIATAVLSHAPGSHGEHLLHVYEL